MRYYAGLDWSENLQDWAVMDETGRHCKHGKIPLTPAGIAELVEGLGRFLDPDTGEFPPLAIETGRGVLVSSLQSEGVTVHPVNPFVAKQYATRKNVKGKKNDKADAFSLASALRYDLADHRAAPCFTDQGRALTQMGRAHQDVLWKSLRHTNEVRSLLQEFWPHANTVFKPTDIAGKPEVRAVLAAWPDPTMAQHVTKTRLRKVLKDAGRSRYVERDVDLWFDALRVPALHSPPMLEHAYGDHLRVLLATLDTTAALEVALRHQAITAMHAHPLAALVDTVPGLGGITAARIIGEIGDDPRRFTSVKTLRAFAGTSPETRSSSTSSSTKRRHVKNNRVNHSAFLWAFNSLTASPGARAYYDNRRDGRTMQGQPLKDKHAAALRNISNVLIGAWWHCASTGEAWDERKVWPRFATTAQVPEPDERPDDALDADDDLRRLLDAEQAVDTLLHPSSHTNNDDQDADEPEDPFS